MVMAIVVHLIAIKFIAPEDNDYVYGIIAKHKRLDNMKGPRVLFGGGSNVAFGIDSKMVEDSLHLETANLGIHAGLGLDFILNELEHSAKAGDVIFISPEYLLGEGRYGLEKAASDAYPPAAEYYPNSLWLDLNHYIPKLDDQINANKLQLLRLLPGSNKTPSVYNKHSFNEHGDLIAHLNVTPPGNILPPPVLEYRYWEGIDKINALAKRLAQKNVTMYFFYPCYASVAWDLNKDVLKHCQADIDKALQIPVLNTPEDFIFPTDHFFDTAYHLRKEIRTIRTQKMIAIIRQKVPLPRQ